MKEFIENLNDLELAQLRYELKQTQPHDKDWLDAVENEFRKRRKYD